jgi:hypothetical protein
MPIYEGISLITSGLPVRPICSVRLERMLLSSDSMDTIVEHLLGRETGSSSLVPIGMKPKFVDVYFSADVETDGPIPGPFSMLSLGLVFAGAFDGETFSRPNDYSQSFYREFRPISDDFEIDALKVNGLDRDLLLREGSLPEIAMNEASQWVRMLAGGGRPVLVAYPLSFDWSFLYWYFIRFSVDGSPFKYSQCFDIKTAYAVKAHIPISAAGRSNLVPSLRSHAVHSHNALEDAIEQAQIFANLFEWDGKNGKSH